MIISLPCRLPQRITHLQAPFVFIPLYTWCQM